MTRLDFNNNKVINIVKSIRPSALGELELTVVNQRYPELAHSVLETLGHGVRRLDVVTRERLLEASILIAAIEKQRGLKPACPESIAFRNDWISAEAFENLAEEQAKTSNGAYLREILNLRVISRQ